ncbi:hypothetical protein ND861_04295 [Leptospira sp. 2 VSF19]|uniref:Uncharacterized protein n=1 Tax=Leptospira soteropolitanensis TaxID=2950025 RepID=A0AAW5VCC1_9LEPT|nr:hypothetical protein [Leptospira soteropolitanensis]MCW7491869.1 hypothetical protein [Leptospira soteropolitanensis]MCW7499453.1 hypothetical protein [Leptospira soteropolitanensis]MCW7520956.1 hypothetical protein [Leptospira soteropolitanensis]MCW7525557.1 hypothetical protein [Leptospira soteropolitanensis]MCW7529423.1 hypothetical protein [Leptospira soteropolitanensis]
MDFYPDMNLEFKSSFVKTNQFLANTQDETLLPQMGLAARNLLNLEQMTKLREIRKRHLKKGRQREGFHWD